MVFLPDLWAWPFCVVLSAAFKRNAAQYKGIFVHAKAGGFGSLWGWPSFEGSIRNWVCVSGTKPQIQQLQLTTSEAFQVSLYNKMCFCNVPWFMHSHPLISAPFWLKNKANTGKNVLPIINTSISLQFFPQITFFPQFINCFWKSVILFSLYTNPDM